MLFTTGVAAMFLGFYGVFFNLEEWAARTGVGFRGDAPPPNAPARGLQTAWLLAIMNLSSLVGRLGSSYLSDHFGAVNVHAVVASIAGGLCVLLWTFALTFSPALAFVILFGAFSGALIGLPPASVAAILGPEHEAQAKLGQWTGMMYSLAAVPALVGPVIGGHLISRYGYLALQVFCGACILPVSYTHLTLPTIYSV